jgi:hypothetical protein
VSFPRSDKPHIDGFEALASFGHVHHDTLAVGESAETGAVQGRDVDEDIFAAEVPEDETETLIGVIEFHGAEFLDGRQTGNRRKT